MRNSWSARRRIRKQQKIADRLGTGTPHPDEVERSEIPDFRHAKRKENLMEGLKFLGISSASCYISYEMLLPTTGQAPAAALSLVSMAAVYLFMVFLVQRTYVPPGNDYLVASLVEPDNPQSDLIDIAYYHIPAAIVSDRITRGKASWFRTQYSDIVYVCNYLKWDPDTGRLDIEYGWPHRTRFNFLLDHRVYETQEPIIAEQQMHLGQLEPRIEVIANEKARIIAMRVVRIALGSFHTGDLEMIASALIEGQKRSRSELENLMYPRGTADPVGLPSQQVQE